MSSLIMTTSKRRRIQLFVTTSNHFRFRSNCKTYVVDPPGGNQRHEPELYMQAALTPLGLRRVADSFRFPAPAPLGQPGPFRVKEVLARA